MHIRTIVFIRPFEQCAVQMGLSLHSRQKCNHICNNKMLMSMHVVHYNWLIDVCFFFTLQKLDKKIRLFRSKYQQTNSLFLLSSTMRVFFQCDIIFFGCIFMVTFFLSLLVSTDILLSGKFNLLLTKSSFFFIFEKRVFFCSNGFQINY